MNAHASQLAVHSDSQPTFAPVKSLVSRSDLPDAVHRINNKACWEEM